MVSAKEEEGVGVPDFQRPEIQDALPMGSDLHAACA